MTTNAAIASRAADFLLTLINNPQERERLRNATAAEIVQAGKEAGYNFTESDLNALIQRATITGLPKTPTPVNCPTWCY